MSAALSISLLVVGAALALWLGHVEFELSRRRRSASYRLEMQERQARADTRPNGHVDITYGGKRLPL